MITLTAFNSVIEVRSEDEDDEDYDSKNNYDTSVLRKNTYKIIDPNLKKQRTLFRAGII